MPLYYSTREHAQAVEKANKEKAAKVAAAEKTIQESTGKTDLKTASIEMIEVVLKKISGVGESNAQRIYDMIHTVGVSTWIGLACCPGLGKNKVDRLKMYFTLESSKLEVDYKNMKDVAKQLKDQLKTYNLKEVRVRSDRQLQTIKVDINEPFPQFDEFRKWAYDTFVFGRTTMDPLGNSDREGIHLEMDEPPDQSRYKKRKQMEEEYKQEKWEEQD